jgi:hypothetical protein
MTHNVGGAAFSLKAGLKNPRVFIARNRDRLVKLKPKGTSYLCERLVSIFFYCEKHKINNGQLAIVVKLLAIKGGFWGQNCLLFLSM